MLSFLMLFSFGVNAQIFNNECWLGDCVVCDVTTTPTCEICLTAQNGVYEKTIDYKVPVLVDAGIPYWGNPTEVTNGNEVTLTANYTCNNGISPYDDYWIKVNWKYEGMHQITQQYYVLGTPTEVRSMKVNVSTANPVKNPSAFVLENIQNCVSPSTRFTIRRLNSTNFIKQHKVLIQECDASGLIIAGGANFSSDFYNIASQSVFDRWAYPHTGDFDFKNGKYYKIIYIVQNACTSYSESSQILHIAPATNTVTVTGNTMPACAGSSFVLQANLNSPTDTYLWDNSTHNLYTNVTDRSLFVSSAPATPVTYTVTVTNSQGCQSTGSKQVVGRPVPTAAVANPYVEVCYGATATIAVANNGGNTYNWSNGVNTAQNTVNTSGNYTVTVTGSNGCSATNSVRVGTSMFGFPEIQITPPPTLRCSGTPHTFNVEDINGEQLNYAWSNGSTNASITVNPTETTTYYVTASNTCGATVSSVTMAVNAVPNISTPNNSVILCANGTVNLSCVSNSPNQTLSYNWSNGANTASITTNQAGNYTVTATNTNGCTATTGLVVTYSTVPAPQLNLTFKHEDQNQTQVNIVPPCAGNYSFGAYIFHNTLHSGNNSFYNVSSEGGLNTLSYNNDLHIYYLSNPSNDVYNVVYTNSVGCTVSTSVRLVRGCCTPTDLIVGNPNTDTNISTLLTDYFHTTTSGFYEPNTNTNLNWTIRGNLVIDENVNFNRAIHFKMCELAKITVANNRELSFTAMGLIEAINSNVLWDRIEVKENGGVSIISPDFTISDAYYAIKALPSFRKVHFIGNGDGIKIQNTDNGIFIEGSQSTLFSDIILDGITFEATRNLNGLNAQMNTGIALKSVSIATYTNNNTYRLRNLLFNHIANGFISFLTSATLGGNIKFRNIQGWTDYNTTSTIAPFPYLGDVSGLALHFGTANALSDPINFNVGGDPNLPAIPTVFEDCAASIMTSGNTEANIRNIQVIDLPNTSPCLFGVQGFLLSNNLLIKDTNIAVEEQGLVFTNCQSHTGIILKNNTINAGMGNSRGQQPHIGINLNAAIFAPCLYTVEDNVIDVHHNNIPTLNNDNIGIYELNIWNDEPTQSAIKHNTIKNTQFGIYAENASTQIIENNIIHNGNMGTPLPEASHSTSIHLANNEQVELKCNSTNDHYRGIMIAGGQTLTAIEQNAIGTHTVGLEYSDGLVGLDDQINTGNTFVGNGNAYAEAAAKTKAVVVDNFMNRFIGRIHTLGGNTTYFPTNQYYKDIAGSGNMEQGDWFESTGDTPPNNCPPRKRIAVNWEDLENFATGEARHATYGDAVKWAMQQKICEYAVNAPDSLIGKPELIAIADSLVGSPMRKLTEIEHSIKQSKAPNAVRALALAAAKTQLITATDSLDAAVIAADETAIAVWTALATTAKMQYQAQIDLQAAATNATLDSLRTINTGIVTQTVQETNAKIVNSIYFRSNGLTATTLRNSDISALQNIAAQCPTTGGKAVYNARGILAFYKHFRLYLDEDNCHAQGAAYRVAKPKAAEKEVNKEVRLYPNPVADYFIVEIGDIQPSTVLSLTDVFGRTVLTQTLNATNTTISTANLAQGIYFVTIIDANGKTNVLPKLIISRP